MLALFGRPTRGLNGLSGVLMACQVDTSRRRLVIIHHCQHHFGKRRAEVATHRLPGSFDGRSEIDVWDVEGIQFSRDRITLLHSPIDHGKMRPVLFDRLKRGGAVRCDNNLRAATLKALQQIICGELRSCNNDELQSAKVSSHSTIQSAIRRDTRPLVWS